MLVQKKCLSLVLFILLLFAIPAHSKAPIFIKGTVTTDHLDTNFVSVKDQFGQIFLIPRSLIKNGNSILTGAKIELQIPTDNFKKLKRL